jgi:hypothetical protein
MHSARWVLPNAEPIIHQFVEAVAQHIQRESTGKMPAKTNIPHLNSHTI